MPTKKTKKTEIMALKSEVRYLRKEISFLQSQKLIEESKLNGQILRKNSLLRQILKWLAESKSPNPIYGVELISKEVLP